MSTFENVLWDIETNGLLPGEVAPEFAMDRIHCLGVLDLDAGEKLIFRRNEQQDDIAEGVDLIEKSKFDVGHNTLDFDHRALRLLFPNYQRDGRTLDTLVMSRMVFADIKESDFRMVSKGQLEGRLIGTHGLESWGQRLGLHKGDYKKAREQLLKELHRQQGLEPPTKAELHQFVWGTWNQEMEDYMVLDLDVNKLLWDKIKEANWSQEATVLEHRVHALMLLQQENGFLFDVEKAQALEADLRREHERLSSEAVAEIGQWYRPVKVARDEYHAAFGEHSERRTWGVVTEPKKTLTYDKSNAASFASGTYDKLRANRVAEAPFVAVELKEFNPNSRPQIIDRLQTLYGWEPQDFTENGTPKVDDEVMRDLAEHIPLALTLAEVFYFKKRLGQVADGQNGWLKLVRADMRIHGRVNVGGTVSGRATHAAPNISQVPGVNAVEFGAKERTPEALARAKDKGINFIQKHAPLVNSWGAPIIVSEKWNERKGEYKILTRGRTGGYGYDCRELFHVPGGFRLVGCDLSGIEFRCLANLTYPFDDGELVDIVLNGDIHQKNADLAGISRSVAKRLLYACVDMETMALTKQGWKHYQDLRVGDLVMTYNMARDVKEWKPLQHLHFVPGAKRVRVKGRGIDVVCTPDHRWATIRRTTVGGEPTEIFEYCRTDELTKSHRVIANAPFAGDADGTSVDLLAAKYRDDLTEHVLALPQASRRAWLHGFLTADGHQRSRHPDRWGFTQKPGVTFEAALAVHFTEHANRLTTSGMVGSPCWKTEVCDSRTWGCQKIEIEPVEDGDVWCMTTENSSFVMRRGNFVTITGNCMYGGGDSKLGSIVEPFATEARQRTVGAQLREKLMRAMPSLKAAIRQIHKEMRLNGGTILGLDGRRLFVRSKHSALNLRLQSDGAIIAKKWVLLADEMMAAEGWSHHVEDDYAFCSWSHDEIQVAVRNELADAAARIMEGAAPLAGQHFRFNCPVSAEAKIGGSWAETH